MKEEKNPAQPRYDTRLLRGKQGVAEAGALLARGELVAIPTETVYGLAANALDENAVRRIFEAKGRPQDNPLIVHISHLSQLAELALDIPESAYTLARAFWPGPMTMVLKKAPCIPLRTSGGLDTVGIRMPAHPMARAIIDAAGVPLAAPSANTSGKPSPTSARDTLDDMRGKIPAVVEGGNCAVGVESTVVDMTGPAPKVLRPGAITEEMIAAAVGAASTDSAVYRGLTQGEKAKAPGMKYRHYAPKAPVLLFEGPPDRTFPALLAESGQSWDGVLCFEEYLPQMREKRSRLVYSLGFSWDHREHAKRVFALLRHFDHTGARRILAQCPRAFGANAGAVNRLRKSAGFHSVDCREGKLVIGVTGRSGSGKSVLSRVLAGEGALVLDADGIYQELLLRDEAMLAEIEARFPGTVKNGVMDRREVGRRVFSDPQALRDLDEITHRRVKAEMARRIAETENPRVVLDVPILFDSGIDRLCDLTVGVLLPREVSLARIMRRDSIDESRARARLDSQPGDDYYAARCDVLLHNTGDQAAFEAQARAFWEKYCK